MNTNSNTDTNFDEVVATVDEAPPQKDVNYAIVECLEGTERKNKLIV